MTSDSAGGPAGQAVGCCILVVDDNLQNRVLVQAQLSSAGYDVALAPGGEEALALLAERSFDLILLDVLMPGIDGFETCRRIRRRAGGAEPAIIFLTALEGLEAHSAALSSGADDFLTKPINRTELLMRVQSLMRIKQLKDELRQGYELIRAQRDALLQAQEQRVQLSAMIVHDLKSPLASIIANTSWLVQELTEDQDHREAAQDSLEAARNMNRLVLNLLELSRDEEKVLVPCCNPTDLVVLVREVVHDSARRAEQARQELVLEACPEQCVIPADPDLLRRLVDNLVDNALKYSPAGSKTRLWLRQEDDGTTVLRVADQGPGIPPAEREHIFERYVQLSPGTLPPEQAKGGLGLAFCRMAAGMHGGRLWIEDNEPQGAVFCLQIPPRKS